MSSYIPFDPSILKKPKVSNIKIGGGNLRVGKGVVANQLSSWNGTGDPVTWTDLTDRPEYYAREVSKYFKLDGQWNKSTHIKNPFEVYEGKGINRPNEFAANGDSDYDDSLIFFGSISGHYDDSYHKEYYHKPYYNLSRIHPEKGLLTTRKIKYFYTCEEINTILTEDLLYNDQSDSHSNIFTSTYGDISDPTFGPYFIQKSGIGIDSNLPYVSFESDPEKISVALDSYQGGEDNQAYFNIHYEKTGINDFSGYLEVSGCSANNIYSVQISTEVKDISIGRNFAKGPDAYVSTGFFTPDTELADDFYMHESDPVMDNDGVFRINFGISEAENVYTKPVVASLYRHFNTIRYIFDRNVDHVNNPRDPFRIISGYVIQKNQLVYTHTLTPPRYRQFALDVNGDEEYTAEDYFYVGAPDAYMGHKYFDHTGVRIRNVESIKGFRIPPHHVDANYNLHKLEITNCPNLRQFMAPAQSFPNLHYVDLSGCSIITRNNLHPYHPEEFYQDNAFKRYSEGTFPYNLFEKIPDYLIPKYYNSWLTDDKMYQLVQPGDFGGAFQNSVLSHVNLYGNRLNQTGIYRWISNLDTTLAGKKKGSKFGYLNIKNQQGFKDEKCDAVFTGFRYDCYASNYTPEELDFQSESYNKRAMRDVNNLVCSKLVALTVYGWETHFDGKETLISEQGLDTMKSYMPDQDFEDLRNRLIELGEL